MFSLQKIFGKGDKFFDLLEASAEESNHSVRALVETLSAPPKGDRSLEQFILSRRKDKRITEQISELLCKTFVTGLEREDIEALSNALYKIPKTVEKFAERYVVCSQQLEGVTFNRQTTMLEKATATVLRMVKKLRKMPHLEEIKEDNELLQHIEGEADKLMLELLCDLYGGRYQPIQVVVLKDLYELLEKVIDRCRDAGNVVTEIVLKNS